MRRAARHIPASKEYGSPTKKAMAGHAGRKDPPRTPDAGWADGGRGGIFWVDGYKLKCPGDPRTPGYLIYYCRCTMISVDKFHGQNAPRAAKLGEVSYEEWKAGKEIEAAHKWQTITDYSQKVLIIG